VDDWAAFLGTAPADDIGDEVRQHIWSGRPLGSDAFVERVELDLGRELKPQKGGRRPEGVYQRIRIVSPN